jgi:hypothetical protein
VYTAPGVHITEESAIHAGQAAIARLEGKVRRR